MWYCFITTHQGSCKKVMFSVMCVSQSVRIEGSPHVTITHDALEYTTKPPPPRHET